MNNNSQKSHTSGIENELHVSEVEVVINSSIHIIL